MIFKLQNKEQSNLGPHFLLFWLQGTNLALSNAFSK